MTPEREQAMTALRAWSTPGVRAHLIERAWRAGETNISALADAAATTRPTVYADLESRGINPRTDRQESPPMQTITVGPYTGSETKQERDEPLRALLIKYRQMPDTPENIEAFAKEGAVHLDQFEAAKYHNTLLPFAQRAAEAREDAHRMLHRVETSWAALRTARAWMAAHHVYVEAVADARTAVTAWTAAADELVEQRTKLEHGWSGATNGTYEKYEEYVPAEQRIPRLDADEPKLAAAELEESHLRRSAIAAETLRHSAGE